VAYCDCGAFEQQLHGHRAADDVGCADDNRVLALVRGVYAVQQGDDACGRAGSQGRFALHQAADVVGVEAVHILVRADLYQNGVWVHMVGQGKLHQDAVYVRVLVELVNQCLQGLL